MPARPARWRPAVAALAGWTLFTWTTRVPLLWGDAELGVGEKVLSTVPVAVFVALGAAVVVGLVTRRPWAATVGVGLAGWSLAFWAVRVPQIALAGHEAGFVAVHAVLGTVAAALSAWVLRTRPRRAGAPDGDGPVRAPSTVGGA